MGEVYRATHALLKRPTAIKLLRPDAGGADRLARFENEVRQTSRLTHPNTVSIYDYGRTPEGTFYYAMELLEGLDLQEIVQRTGPMPPARTIHVLVQACNALAEAHDKGLVHRDLKPRNLILCERGGEWDVLKVVDFGLVKDLSGTDPSLTVAGAICGTPETVPPEAITGGTVGPAADLYSLACVGCYLLTGQGIFDAGSAAEYLTKHLHEQPVPPSRRNPDLPRDLEAVLLRCLRKEPTERFPDARALRRALEDCAEGGKWGPDEARAWWAAAGVPPAGSSG
jgi:serine/threonine-protein kinase